MFASNVGISTSHNNHIILKKGEERTFRVLLRPEEGGRLIWRFWFSNTVDSTWDNGAQSYANLPGGRFEIVAATAGAADTQAALGALLPVTWSKTAVVEPRACVTSDEVTLNVPTEGYIAFSWCLRALEEDCVLPATPDSQALCFSAPGNAAAAGMDAFEENPMTVLPDLFAADRNVKRRMVFMGDSITQGCQTRVNHYEQWATRIAMGMQQDVSVWNIGLGFGRAGDAATDGAWLAKAAQGDIVNVCFGVNDIFQTHNGPLLIENLRRVVALLQARGARVVLLTVPPFDMEGDNERMWRAAVEAIRADGLGADAVFDIASMLSEPAPRDHFAAFGGHPNGRGGATVAGEYLSAFWPAWREKLMNRR